jgi:hypothetical protein
MQSDHAGLSVRDGAYAARLWLEGAPQREIGSAIEAKYDRILAILERGATP